MKQIQTQRAVNMATAGVAMLTKYFGPDKLSEKAATDMVAKYGVEAVLQQFNWLESRETDMPLRTLRAALKSNWGEPKPVGKPEHETFTPEEMVMMTARMNEPNEPSPSPAHVPSSHADPMWQEVKARIQMQLTQATYNSCIRQTELIGVEGNQWLIQCESTFAQDWLENRLNNTLTRTAASVAGQGVELKFVVNGQISEMANGRINER